MKQQLARIDRLKRAYERAKGLQHVTTALSKAFTEKKVAEIIINEGFSVLKADSVDIVMLHENRKTFDVIAFRGYSKNFLKKLHKNKSPLLTDIVVKTKKPLFIYPRSKVRKKYKIAWAFLQHTQTTSAALLPLIIRNTVIGVMQYSFRNPYIFQKEDKEFMQTLVDQCAQAFDRVTAIENLKKSKEELEIILKNVVDGILVQDNTGKVIYANQEAAAYLGYKSTDELLAAPIYEDIDRFYIRDEFGKPFLIDQLPGRRAIQGARNSQVVLQFIHKKTGERRWLSIKSTAIKNVQEKPTIVINVMHDMTQEKDLEQRKDDFIGMASHELKTPLTTIKIFTQIIKKMIGDEKNSTVEAYWGKMDSQLNKLSFIINDLLDITKIQKGSLDLHKEAFVLDELLQELAETMQPITENTLETSLTSGITVNADKDRITQVITNLITNAIKYSPEGKKIIISSKKVVNEIIVSVRDFGIGIAPDKKEKVFGRFYRAEEEQKTYPGLGLGLYISSEIVKAHGGKIWVTSTPGKGSTFSFSFPVPENM